MRGERELKAISATLEEIMAAVAKDGVPEERLVALGGRHLAAVEELRGLFDELGESERAELQALMVDVGRLNALASTSASREYERLGGEIEKVRRAADMLRRRKDDLSGHSCDLSG